jgi:hypothetical protein
MVEGFDKMLRVIQIYFTCEGSFNMIYQYHIRLFFALHWQRPHEYPFLFV